MRAVSVLALCLCLAACADAQGDGPSPFDPPPSDHMPPERSAGDSLTVESTAEGYTLRLTARCVRAEPLCPFHAEVHADPARLAAVSGVDYTFVPGRRESPAPPSDAASHFAFEDRQTYGELVYAQVRLRPEGGAEARTVLVEASIPYTAEVRPTLPAGLRFEDHYREQFLEGTPSGTWHFRVYLRGDAEALAGVRSVEYHLPDVPYVTNEHVSATAGRDFLLDGTITPEVPFDVTAEIRWANGRRSTHTLPLQIR